MNATPTADAQRSETVEDRTGGCLCGRIRFTAQGPAVFPHTCECEHCQKLGGTPVMWWVGFKTITWIGEGGEPTWYETFEGEAGRGFCPDCGSRLAAVDSDVPELGIVVTALDDTSGRDLVPVDQSFREDAVDWLSQAPRGSERPRLPERPRRPEHPRRLTPPRSPGPTVPDCRPGSRAALDPVRPWTPCGPGPRAAPDPVRGACGPGPSAPRPASRRPLRDLLPGGAGHAVAAGPLDAHDACIRRATERRTSSLRSLRPPRAVGGKRQVRPGAVGDGDG